jgi:hypothetical protein
MTREEFTRSLPPIAFYQLGLKPPLLFRGVTAHCFPISASLDVLQQLCDSYLNIVPKEAGFFRVPWPYVFLTVLDYGQMGEAVMQAGWFSQVEIYFGIFVEWYKRIRGQWEFHDWGVVTPYIFVSDDVSVAVGRTVYGFPKIPAEVKKVDSRWIGNPAARTMLARIKTEVFPKAYAGTTIKNLVLLEINRTPAPGLQVPFDPASLLAPWTIGANVADAIGGLGRDALWLAQAMRICPTIPLTDPRLFGQMLGHVPLWFAPRGPGFVINSLNLKQFRDAQHPSLICYQALTNARMLTTSFNAGAMLGQSELLLGDLSGGYSVKLYQHSSIPICQTLGLEVHGSATAGGVTFDEFKPVAPFWMNVDLTLDRGVNLAWRTENGQWKDETGEPFASARKSADPPEYNNAVATTIEAITGPFEFGDVVMHVLPLKANKRTLETFLNCYLNEPFQDPINNPIRLKDGTPIEIRFEVLTPHDVGGKLPGEGIIHVEDLTYVFLITRSCGTVTSITNNVGNWTKDALQFVIPVKFCCRVANEEWKVLDIGLVSAFTYVDSDITAFTSLEIVGIPTTMAKFSAPKNPWIRSEGTPAKLQTLLCMNVELLAALGTGQTAAFYPLIEITRSDRMSAKEGGANLWKMSHSKFSQSRSFFSYVLKQLPDVTDPDKACYQSLVRVQQSWSGVGKQGLSMEDEMEVRIYNYPTLHIATTLGLEGRTVYEPAAGIVHCAHAETPFSVHATVVQPCAEQLAVRAGTRTWTLDDRALQQLLKSTQR